MRSLVTAMPAYESRGSVRRARRTGRWGARQPPSSDARRVGSAVSQPSAARRPRLVSTGSVRKDANCAFRRATPASRGRGACDRSRASFLGLATLIEPVSSGSALSGPVPKRRFRRRSVAGRGSTQSVSDPQPASGSRRSGRGPRARPDRPARGLGRRHGSRDRSPSASRRQAGIGSVAAGSRAATVTGAAGGAASGSTVPALERRRVRRASSGAAATCAFSAWHSGRQANRDTEQSSSTLTATGPVAPDDPPRIMEAPATAE
jgi:hypothetical protein